MSTRNGIVCLLVLLGLVMVPGMVSAEGAWPQGLELRATPPGQPVASFQTNSRPMLLAMSDEETLPGSPMVEDMAAEAPEAPSCGLTFGQDWASKYMTRGGDVTDDRGSYQPWVDWSIGDTGLTLHWWAAISTAGRDNVNRIQDLDEMDYGISYSGATLDGCMEYTTGIWYFDVYHMKSNQADFWEWYAHFSFPEMPLSPGAGINYAFPNNDSVGFEGWWTYLGIYPSIPLCNTELSLDTSLEFIYNGGAFWGPTGWTHLVCGTSISFPVCGSLSFTPGVYYQHTMSDDMVNFGLADRDEWWTHLSLVWSF